MRASSLTVNGTTIHGDTEFIRETYDNITAMIRAGGTKEYAVTSSEDGGTSMIVFFVTPASTVSADFAFESADELTAYKSTF